ncbi:hypothetical protein EG799_11170 [Aurantiacibacter spongiae]|uniref:Phage shock protein B n=2 Tax=Aurantiacibacter spongiae TaxID=2488860 RepID=A0A3N5CYP1_9SPHN|nr:hypothetical protein EG799_11170 [Aurantiacibacter spongiae]
MLIFGFIIAILMIALPFAYIVSRRQNEHEERKLELEARRAEAERGTDPAGRKLEERVRVLERIVTDRGQDLARQIEDLRRIEGAVDKERAR